MCNTVQQEEGWRWRKTFIIKYEKNGATKEYHVDEIHDRMNEEVAELRTKFISLIQMLPKVIDAIRTSNGCMYEIFESLSAGDNTIRDIVKNDSSKSKNLKEYWMKNDDLDSGNTVLNETIMKIIVQNLKRLTTRNLALATIGTTTVKGDYMYIPVVDRVEELSQQRKVVFVSGSGNRIVELLEGEFFPGFTFVTFDRPCDRNKLYDGFLKGNLGYILSHVSDRITGDLERKSVNYGKELANNIVSSKDMSNKRLLYNKEFQKLSDAGLELGLITEKILTNKLELINGLEKILKEIHTSCINCQRLIPDFFHSEQLLRLYLYNNLELLIANSINDIVVLHIHSLNDICERCAHCLFLEAEMCNVTRNKGINKVIDPFGFFEKFNNSVKDIKPDLKYQILASSSTVGKQRGVMHRYQSGHDLRSSDPIDLSLFPPLLGFKLIPQDFSLQPLTSTLQLSKSANNRDSLQQTYSYFPAGAPNA